MIIIIDPTDGTMEWYKNPALDENEFIIDVYMNFYDWKPITQELLDQARYPEDLMNEMIQMDYVYHIAANRGRTIWDIQIYYYQSMELLIK
ncbi:MAG: hypothetical protein ACTSPQ_19525 [Candidatus Helarchaeota archaeon]